MSRVGRKVTAFSAVVWPWFLFMPKPSGFPRLCLVGLALASGSGADGREAPGSPAPPRPEAWDRISLPVVDISAETERHVFVARGTKTDWNGHCSTVLLPDGKTIYCVWQGRRDGTRRHEAPVAFMKRSDDGGLSWSDELALPASWMEIGRGAPTIHRLVDGRGKARLCVFCRTEGRTTFLQGISEDDGKTWSDLRPVAVAAAASGPITGWTAPITIVEATAPDGRRRHLMWYERARERDPTSYDRVQRSRGIGQAPEPGVIWQSASYDGGLTWGESKPIVNRAGACEPACVRSPDGRQLLILIRDETRQANSLMATSDDEGETWSQPRELPLAVTGDRFLPRYAPDGRLVILFRPVPYKLPPGSLKAPWNFPDGSCTAWVGRYEDLVAGREGECLIRLLRSHRGADHTYPGLEVLPDGSFVATTYIQYRPGDDELHSVVSVRFRLDEIEAGKTRTSPAATAAADPPRWNILFLFADDWGRYASCYRGLDGRPGLNDVVATPAIDRLAREGVLFRNAFVSAPSCTPCRSSLLSGRPFFACGRGAILLNAVWDESIPTFPLLLEGAGYRIGKSYKVWSPGRPADAPFGGQRRAFEAAGRLPNDFSEHATRMVAEGKTFAAAKEAIVAQIRGNFRTFLADAAAGPWLYFCGPTNTHRTWVKGSGKALWGIDPDALRGRMPAFLPDVPEVREDVADYLGEVQAVDAYLAALVAELETAGLLDSTLVVASGDHGMPGVPAGKCELHDHGTAVPLVARVPGGTPGRIVDDFVSLPELAPTFLEVAGVRRPAGMTAPSLLPALLSDRGGQLDPARSFVITGRERHVDTARDGNLPYPMRGIRTADHLYIRNFAPDRLPLGRPGIAAAGADADAEALEHDTFAAYPDMDASPTKAWVVRHGTVAEWRWLSDYTFGPRPGEELYDLRADPDQIRNVAADPDHAAVRRELAARLDSLLRGAGDPRLAADVPFEKPPFTDLEPRGGVSRDAGTSR